MTRNRAPSANVRLLSASSIQKLSCTLSRTDVLNFGRVGDNDFGNCTIELCARRCWLNQSSDRKYGYCPSTGNIHRCPGSKDEPLLLNFRCCSRARAQSQPSPTDEVDRLACAILSFVFYLHLRGTRNNGCGPPRVKMTSTWLEINLFADQQRCTALLRRFNCASESRCWQGPRYDSAGTPYRLTEPG